MDSGFYLRWVWTKNANDRWVEEKTAVVRWIYVPVCDYALELRDEWGNGPAFDDDLLHGRIKQ